MSTEVLDRPDRSELLSDAEWSEEAQRPSWRPSGTATIASSAAPIAFRFGDVRLVFNEPPAVWSREVIKRICTLGDLKENWDSYGARRIDPFCAMAAVDLILSVMGADVPIPAVVPTSRGGVQLEWHCGGMDLEIVVESPSRFRIAFEDEQANEQIESELTSDLRPLARLIDRISKAD